MEVNFRDPFSETEHLQNTCIDEMGSEGSQAFFVDGKYLIPANLKTTLLLPDTYQYNSTSDIGELANLENDAELENLPESNGIIRFINNDALFFKESQNEIVYFTNEVEQDFEDMNSTEIAQVAYLDTQGAALNGSNVETEYINLDSLIDDLNNSENSQNNEIRGDYKFVLHLDDLDQFGISQENNTSEGIRDKMRCDDSSTIDISKIKGKNLLTGQSVTLDSYLEKVKISNKEMTLEKAEEMARNLKRKNHNIALSNLLNKKLTIGKTQNGEKLVGKVIHVGKKETVVPDQILLPVEETSGTIMEFCMDVPEMKVENDPDSMIWFGNVESNNDYNKIIADLNINESENETFSDELNEHNELVLNMVDHVSKTLTNLMSMDSVSRKLKRKNLRIKVTEKMMNKCDRITKPKTVVHHMQGHLELLGGLEEEEYEERWILRLNEEKIEEENLNIDGDNTNSKDFLETTRLSISVVQQDGVAQTTKVVLGFYKEKCALCSKSFRTMNRLKNHLRLAHKIENDRFLCRYCGVFLEKADALREHRRMHIIKKERFKGARHREKNRADAPKCFETYESTTRQRRDDRSDDSSVNNDNKVTADEATSTTSATRTKTTARGLLDNNNRRPHACRQCDKHFATAVDLNYHARVHDPKSCYVCKVCNRTFSRYSNLQRHAEIHGTKNSKAVYSCSMCGCTYNYVSSLTRHIVQNHISS